MAVFVKDVTKLTASQKQDTLRKLQATSEFKLYIFRNNIVHDMVKK